MTDKWKMKELEYNGTTLVFGNINIFHGANGSGKTTLLEYIRGVYNIHYAGEDPLVIPDTPYEGKGQGHHNVAELKTFLATTRLTAIAVDCPECGLGGALQREVAAMLVSAAHRGLQVFVITHSLFLLRELELLWWSDKNTEEPLKWRWFGLRSSDDGTGRPEITQGDGLCEAGPPDILDEELKQVEKYTVYSNDEG